VWANVLRKGEESDLTQRTQRQNAEVVEKRRGELERMRRGAEAEIR
jgi:hypothetical protein